MKRYFTSHFTGYAENKVKAAIEYPFPQPIYGLKYGKDSLLIVGRLAGRYSCSQNMFSHQSQRGDVGPKTRWNVVALGLFPVFALCLVVVDNPVPRYWLPSVLLLLPPAFVVSPNCHRRCTSWVGDFGREAFRVNPRSLMRLATGALVPQVAKRIRSSAPYPALQSRLILDLCRDGVEELAGLDVDAGM